MSRDSLKSVCSSIAALLIVGAIATPVRAQQQPAMLTVTPEQGQGLTGIAPNVQVWAGRATAIDFSRIGERITQIFLADPSRLTYTTDVPVESGMASTVFLRQISPLNFPNLTKAYVTNLFVKTQSKDGQLHLYTFNILPGQKQSTYSGLAIAPAPKSAGSFVLQVGSFRPATLDDIERGLGVALRRGYTPASDPIVTKVRDFLALARNETNNRSLVEIATGQQVSLSVLTELGKLGIEASMLNTPPTRVQDTPAKAGVNDTNIAPAPRTASTTPTPKATALKGAIAPTTAPTRTIVNLHSAPTQPKVKGDRVLPIKTQAERTPATTGAAKLSQEAINDINALRKGLQVARSKKQINYGTTKWKQAQSIILWLAHGDSREEAARKAGVSIETVTQLIKWGQ